MTVTAEPVHAGDGGPRNGGTRSEVPTVSGSVSRGKEARAVAPRASHAAFEFARDRRDPVEVLQRPGAHPRAGARPHPLRPHARLAVRVLPRRGGDHGRGPSVHAAVGPARAVLRRRAPVQLRRVRLTRPAARLRPQRLRRDAPGPWEWDVERLAASMLIAAQRNGFRRRDQRRVVLACVGSHRGAMATFAAMGKLGSGTRASRSRTFLRSTPRSSSRGR
jgi:hypothetical protein